LWQGHFDVWQCPFFFTTLPPSIMTLPHDLMTLPHELWPCHQNGGKVIFSYGKYIVLVC
jgi:hypothetical protein